MLTTDLKVKTKGVEIADLICIPKKLGRRKMICFKGAELITCMTLITFITKLALCVIMVGASMVQVNIARMSTYDGRKNIIFRQ